jgi:peptidoglycan/xylan/chitin deacetylase (PgdA/CDA1 family)
VSERVGPQQAGPGQPGRGGRVRRLLRRLPLQPIALVAIFSLLQFGGVRMYLRYDDLIKNVDLGLVREVYLPAMLHAPKADPKAVRAATDPARSVPVLVYHGIVTKPDGSNVEVSNFRDQMFALKRDGWRAIAIADFERYLGAGQPLPAKSFLLTFDDGRKDSYYPVDPILKALGFHATMFVITSHAFRTSGPESTYYLNRDELIRMRNSGRWDLEAHTRNGHDLLPIDASGRKGHFFSNLLWLPAEKRLETQAEFQERVRQDLHGAKADLERQLGTEVSTFAFPFGDYGQDTLNNPQARDFVLREVAATYRYAFAQEESSTATYSQNSPGADAVLLHRIKVYPDWTGSNLDKIIDIGVPKSETFDDRFDDHRGWMPTYGRMQLDGAVMRVEAAPAVAPAPGGTSASVGLDGSADWRDYAYSAQLTWPVGGAVTLVARYRDELDYVACTMSAKRFRVEQRIAGQVQILRESLLPGPPAAEVTLGITVKGAAVTCAGPLTLTASADAAAVPATGGIGIKVWDPEPGKAATTVRSVHVTPA